MADDDLTIKLSRDQAFVLSDWLDRMMGTPTFDNLVNEERAVWSPLHTIAGTPDRPAAWPALAFSLWARQPPRPCDG